MKAAPQPAPGHTTRGTSPALIAAHGPQAGRRFDNGGSLENAQAMAAHESPRTTKLYDRTDHQITLGGREDWNLVECNTFSEYPGQSVQSDGP
jgi:hypothetical protein